MKKNIWLFPILLLVCASTYSAPRGLFVLGSMNQQPVAMDNPNFDGFTMRLQWKDLETSQGVYNFQAISSAINTANQHGKKLTLEIFNLETPTYIQNTPGVEKYTAYSPLGDVVTSVPWDAFTQQRWLAFCQALGFQFGNNPTIVNIDSPIPGMQGIRDIGRRIVTAPGYTREKFISAVIQSVHAMEDQFPIADNFIAFFPISDNQQPSLDVAIFDALNAEFNAGPTPTLGFFEENLSCSKPQPSWAWMMDHPSTYTMFQMLQSWIQPYQNPASTDACLVTTTPGNRNTAISGPEVGIQHGINNFGTLYFEIYQKDAEHPGFQDEFQTMHNLIWN